MKKCCVKCCANDRMVDPEKFRSKMVTVKELSLDSFKHVPLETWALEPEATYKGENDKVHPWTCQTCIKKKLQGVSNNDNVKAKRVGTLCLSILHSVIGVRCFLRLRRRGGWSWRKGCSIHFCCYQ